MDGTPTRPDDAARPAPGAAGTPTDERPMTPQERDTVEKTSAPATAAAGAVAGAAAGLATGAFGVVAVPVGAVIGALAGGLGGWFAGEAATHTTYTEEDDAHYRALYEGTPERPADWAYDRVRPAYQFGHVAAHNPDYHGRDFDTIETELRRAWSGDLVTRHGDWTQARRYARDAYGRARSAGAGVRRDERVIGSGGSAVDPVELDRARAGLPSVDEGASRATISYDHSGYADVNNENAAVAARSGTDRSGSGGLGERPEVDAQTGHRGPSDTEYH